MCSGSEITDTLGYTCIKMYKVSSSCKSSQALYTFQKRQTKSCRQKEQLQPTRTIHFLQHSNSLQSCLNTSSWASYLQSLQAKCLIPTLSRLDSYFHYLNKKYQSSNIYSHLDLTWKTHQHQLISCKIKKAIH